MVADIKDIKELAKKFTPEQIESCITQQIKTGQNVCLTDKSTEKIISELAKVSYIKRLMRKGMTVAEALRELANRIRQVQRGFR